MNEKIELLVRIFCLILIIALNLAIYLNGKSLDCNKCIINFEAFKESYSNAYDKPAQEFSVKITDLYNEFKLNNSCLVKYEEQGYMIKNVTKAKFNN